jgi:hypothetical protein
MKEEEAKRNAQKREFNNSGVVSRPSGSVGVLEMMKRSLSQESRRGQKAGHQ